MKREEWEELLGVGEEGKLVPVGLDNPEKEPVRGRWMSSEKDECLVLVPPAAYGLSERVDLMLLERCSPTTAGEEGPP